MMVKAVMRTMSSPSMPIAPACCCCRCR